MSYVSPSKLIFRQISSVVQTDIGSMSELFPRGEANLFGSSLPDLLGHLVSG